MKNFVFKFLIPFLAFLFMASPIVSKLSEVAQPAFGISPAVLMFALIVVTLFSVAYFRNPRTSGITAMSVEVEVWANYIIERFWKDNQFMAHAFSDDDKVLAGKIVHIPQPGARPTVVKNRSVYPGTAVHRADTDILYALNEYTTDPTHITNIDKVELSYDKINSVYGDHAGYLAQDVADDAIVTWLSTLPQTSILKTSGANTSVILDGATGTRKVMLHNDLKKAQLKMNKQNVPQEDRYALVSADMLDQLTSSLNETQFNAFSQYFNAQTGVLGKLYGFNIMMRSSVATFDLDGGGNLVVNPFGSEIGNDTKDVTFCWQQNAIARALGEVKFFENPDRVEYYGDIYSALLRFGGRRRRADDYGVVAIVQDMGV